jgi:hypothetical protein
LPRLGDCRWKFSNLGSILQNSTFRPKTLRVNMYPKILDKVTPKKKQKILYEYYGQ